MKSQSYQLLESEFMRTRITQNMAFQTIDQLISHLDPQLLHLLTRTIVRTKAVSRRTTLDNYILMRSCVVFTFFDSILKDKGEKALAEVCKHLHYGEVDKGREIYSIGDTADRFFVIMRGEVSVQIPYKELEVRGDGEEVVIEGVREAARLRLGEVFGETTLKENAKRAVNTVAVTDCEFFQIKKRDYDVIIKYMIISQMRAKFMFLQQIELFSKLNQTNLQSLLYVMEKKQINIGHRLYYEGDEVNYVYVVKGGEFKLQKKMPEEKGKSELAKLKLDHKMPKKCSIFVVGRREVLGDVEMFSSGARQHTCVCITETAEVFRISKKDFQSKIMQDSNNDMNGIMDYLYSKNMYIAQRLDEYSRVDRVIQRRRNTLALTRNSFFVQKSSTQTMPSFNPDFNITQNPIVASRIGNRQYDTDEKTPYRLLRQKKKSIRSQSLQNVGSYMPARTTSVPFAAKMISDIVKQKRKYIRLRGIGENHAFELSKQLPTYFLVKMNLKKPERCKTEANSESPSKDQEPPKSVFQQFHQAKQKIRIKTQLKNRKQPQRKSATPMTQYGQFFTRLLAVE